MARPRARRDGRDNGQTTPVSEFLHDLEEDPDQLQNFVDAEEYGQVLVRMRGRCDELMNGCGGALVPLSERVKKPKVQKRTKKKS